MIWRLEVLSLRSQTCCLKEVGGALWAWGEDLQTLFRAERLFYHLLCMFGWWLPSCFVYLNGNVHSALILFPIWVKPNLQPYTQPYGWCENMNDVWCPVRLTIARELDCNVKNACVTECREYHSGSHACAGRWIHTRAHSLLNHSLFVPEKSQSNSLLYLSLW